MAVMQLGVPIPGSKGTRQEPLKFLHTHELPEVLVTNADSGSVYLGGPGTSV